MPEQAREELWSGLPGAEELHTLTDWGRLHVPPLMEIRMRFWPQRAPAPGWVFGIWVTRIEPPVDLRQKVVKYDDSVLVPYWAPIGGMRVWAPTLPWQMKAWVWDFEVAGAWVLPIEMRQGGWWTEMKVVGPHALVDELPLGWDPFAY